jgi:hypothetical protein
MASNIRPAPVNQATEIAKDAVQFFTGLGMMYTGFSAVGGAILSFQSGKRLAEAVWKQGELPGPSDILSGLTKRVLPRYAKLIETHKDHLTTAAATGLAGYGIAKLPGVGQAIEYATGWPATAVATGAAFAGWLYTSGKKANEPPPRQQPKQPVALPSLSSQQQPQFQPPSHTGFSSFQRRPLAPQPNQFGVSTVADDLYGSSSAPQGNLLNAKLTTPIAFDDSQSFQTISAAYNRYKSAWESSTEFGSIQQARGDLMKTVVKAAFQNNPELVPLNLQELRSYTHPDFRNFGALLLLAAQEAGFG